MPESFLTNKVQEFADSHPKAIDFNYDAQVYPDWYGYAFIRRRLSCLRRINQLMEHSDKTHRESLPHHTPLKIQKCPEQQQVVGINIVLLVKMIDAKRDTLAGIRNKVLPSVVYDYLARWSELISRSHQRMLHVDASFERHLE